MSTTQPIRDLDQLNDLKFYYKYEKPNLRNFALITLGVNTALRISDLLVLKWDDIYDFSNNKFRKHLTIQEKKTKKENIIAINNTIIYSFNEYKNSLDTLEPSEYLFPGKYTDSPLSRSQAFRIIRDASNAVNLDGHISCHSLRKTFGYHAWKSGVSPALIMSVYNHSSYNITKRYIGIEQDDKDSIFLAINL